MYKKFFKRFFDIAGSLALLVLLAPFLLIVWIAIRASMGSPAIFTQARPGLGEKIFYLKKFRTMNKACDSSGNLMPDSMRLTALGRFLRKTSIDELPQLFNVLKGEMSFIGPRPLLPQYLPYYTREEKFRHAVRPGISGLAQINGRNCISWDAKLAYDIEYAKNVSFCSDLKIALITVKKVLCCEGIKSANDEVSLDRERVENKIDIGGKTAKMK